MAKRSLSDWFPVGKPYPGVHSRSVLVAFECLKSSRNAGWSQLFQEARGPPELFGLDGCVVSAGWFLACRLRCFGLLLGCDYQAVLQATAQISWLRVLLIRVCVCVFTREGTKPQRFVREVIRSQ